MKINDFYTSNYIGEFSEISSTTVNGVISEYVDLIRQNVITNTSALYNTNAQEILYSNAEMKSFEGGGITETVPHKDSVQTHLLEDIQKGIEGILTANAWQSRQLNFQSFISTTTREQDYNKDDLFYYKWSDLSTVLNISFKELPPIRFQTSSIITAESFFTLMKNLSYVLQNIYSVDYRIIYKKYMSHIDFFVMSPAYSTCPNGKVFRYYKGSKHKNERYRYLLFSDVVITSPLFKHTIISNSYNNNERIIGTYTPAHGIINNNCLYNGRINGDNIGFSAALGGVKLAYVPIQLQSDIPNFNIESNVGSNGVFTAYKTISYNKSNVLENFVSGMQAFVEKGKTIITYKFVINAINMLFKAWLNQLNVMTINVYACHSNCHYNGTDVPSDELPPSTVSFEYSVKDSISTILKWGDAYLGTVPNVEVIDSRVKYKYGNYVFFSKNNRLHIPNISITCPTNPAAVQQSTYELNFSNSSKAAVPMFLYQQFTNANTTDSLTSNFTLSSVEYTAFYTTVFVLSKITNANNPVASRFISINGQNFLSSENNNSISVKVQLENNSVSALERISKLDKISNYIAAENLDASPAAKSFGGWYYKVGNVEHPITDLSSSAAIPYSSRIFTLSAKWIDIATLTLFPNGGSIIKNDSVVQSFTKYYPYDTIPAATGLEVSLSDFVEDNFLTLSADTSAFTGNILNANGNIIATQTINANSHISVYPQWKALSVYFNVPNTVKLANSENNVITAINPAKYVYKLCFYADGRVQYKNRSTNAVEQEFYLSGFDPATYRISWYNKNPQADNSSQYSFNVDNEILDVMSCYLKLDSIS